MKETNTKSHIARLSLFIFLLGISFLSFSQDTLTLEEAIRVALKNNYDIKLVSNDLLVNRNNVSFGNAGLLPSLSANFSDNASIQNSRQVQNTGQVTERTGAKNTNLQYGVGFNWTIFNGFGMFARYEQLKELEKMGEANLQLTILTRVADVMSLYYNLSLQQQQLKALDTAMTISHYRYTLAQNRFEIGRAAKLEVLNASVDLNTDTTNLLRQKELYANTRIQLNELLAREVNTLFVVSDSISIDNRLQLEGLWEQAQKQSPTLQNAVLNMRVADLNQKIVRSYRYPTITLNTGYNFTRATSALGFATQTSGQGLTYGVSANLNLFNGFLQRRNEMNAALVVESAQIQSEKLNQNVRSQLSSAYQTYLTNLSLVQLERNNQKIAKENLNITLDKFQLGSITPLEIRAAQLNYVNATVRYSNACYSAKIAEISLKEISGTLNF